MRRRAAFTVVALCISFTQQSDARHSISARTKITLRYDEKLTAIGFPSPLLRGSIHGQTVWFIIDSGAGVHTLASWLVTTARLAPHTTKARTTGSTGIESAVRAVYGEMIRLEDGEGSIPLREAIVVDLPPIFQQQRIGGLLSPQLLSPPNMAAILDLHTPQLSFGPRPASSPGTRVCRNQNSQFRNRLYAVPASMGNVENLMLVDTGATTSLAAPSSPIALALSGSASVSGRTQGVGGTATTTRTVSDVALTFGDGEATVSLTIGGTPSACAADGLLGMDALRGCRLVLGESTFAWSCRPSPDLLNSHRPVR